MTDIWARSYKGYGERVWAFINVMTVFVVLLVAGFCGTRWWRKIRRRIDDLRPYNEFQLQPAGMKHWQDALRADVPEVDAYFEFENRVRAMLNKRKV
ncbi:hypothetical protein L596_020499 [Steinernema carpocapsae]|uniref:Uncharacterized protein n=1 Tax=Steinernema carpocapsae TaxID=34508 RepID=A0A4U5MTX9_STECR|nr:hypothetical protein L596_020499 [Steinernema carpocapsae]